MDSSSSPILSSEGSPVIILEETGGWWMLVQGTSCTVPVETPDVVALFTLRGFFLPVGS